MSKYTLRNPSRIPWRVWLAVLWAAVLDRRRSPQQDGGLITRSIRPPVTVNGGKNLPAKGPYVVAANHLNGPGLWVGLAAALLAGTIGERTGGAVIRGVGVAAYRDFEVWRVPIPERLTAWLFARFYSVYGIIRMPHLAEGAGPRGGAVRKILAAVKSGEIILLFPEGRNVKDFAMRSVQPGVGDLLRLAHRAGAVVVPAAVAPRGASFEVSIGRHLPLEGECDGAVMEGKLGAAIAGMLPEELRGHYGLMPDVSPAIR